MDADISSIQTPAKNITGSTIGDLLTGGGFNILTLIFFLTGLVFFMNLVIAGWEYMTSAGDPKKIAGASTRLINSFFGIVVVFASFLIVRLITQVISPSTTFF
jgi:hypothetical protein